MRFLLDMPVSPKLLTVLQNHGHTGAHAHQLGYGRAPDSDLLQLARSEAVREASDPLSACPERLYDCLMAIETTYSQAREKLASLMNRVTDDLEVVIITRRGGKRVALIDAAEYEGLLETSHLLRSPRNAERLLLALEQARRGEGLEISVEELRREVLGGERGR